MGVARRDSGAWYRAVCARKSAGLGLEHERRLACGPYGPRGFESHSRRHDTVCFHDLCSRSWNYGRPGEENGRIRI